jgi:two-component system, NtrC family, response regulator AtoC
MAQILIIEDDVLMRQALSRGLAIAHHEVIAVEDGVLGLEELVQRQPDLVLLDVKLREGAFNGIELLGRIRELYPLLPVIIMTGYGTVESAVEAMKQGANDFIQKPFNIGEMAVVIGRVLEVAALHREVDFLRQAQSERFSSGDFVFADETMAQVVDTALRVAEDRATPVLICGEQGTGKDALARWVHRQGQPHSRPLVEVDCAALAGADVDRVLWGAVAHGGVHSLVGKCELADGGTLLLDGVDTLDLRVQDQLLRFMEAKKILRLGARHATAVDVRIIAMSRSELAPLDNGGTMHPDLLFRLGKLSLYLPPLRARQTGEIELLFRSFLCEFAGAETPPDIDEACGQMLAAGNWPGNVRELRNVAECVWIYYSENREIELAELVGAAMGRRAKQADGICAWANSATTGQVFDLFMQELFKEALKRSKGRQAEACRWLGISKARFSYRLKQYRINPQDYT